MNHDLKSVRAIGTPGSSAQLRDIIEMALAGTTLRNSASGTWGR